MIIAKDLCTGTTFDNNIDIILTGGSGQAARTTDCKKSQTQPLQTWWRERAVLEAAYVAANKRTSKLLSQHQNA